MNKQLVYNPKTDLWKSANGDLFVKNEFDPGEPVFINVTEEQWECNEGRIDWSKIDLPKYFIDAAKDVLIKKMKKFSPSYITKYRMMITSVGNVLKTNNIEFDASNASIVFQVLQLIPVRKSKTNYREMYGCMAKRQLLGARLSVYIKLKQVKINKPNSVLKTVLNWHPTKGSLTSEEENLVRNFIENDTRKNEKILGIRIFCWLLFATLKRSMQLRELSRKCIKTVGEQWFVEMKPVKFQTGDPLRLWPIPKALYEAMIEYSSLPNVRRRQIKYNRFFVMGRRPILNGVIQQNNVLFMLEEYFTKIISPRTNNQIVINPTRIRHTGATRLAFAGVSRDIISEILEHDSPKSAQAYIDAIGSELCPQINAADRNMGSFFEKLNFVYFNGKIVDELSDQPISVPITANNSNPLYVGSCGRNTVLTGGCPKHPFISCYNGCPNFLVWREADHKKALDYIETEIARWQATSGGEENTSTIKALEAVRVNILNVMKNIESGFIKT